MCQRVSIFVDIKKSVEDVGYISRIFVADKNTITVLVTIF